MWCRRYARLLAAPCDEEDEDDDEEDKDDDEDEDDEDDDVDDEADDDDEEADDDDDDEENTVLLAPPLLELPTIKFTTVSTSEIPKSRNSTISGTGNLMNGIMTVISGKDCRTEFKKIFSVDVLRILLW